MADTPPNENPKKDFNKIDLTQLQSFSFGTQWAQDKADPSAPRDRDSRRDDRPRRDGPGDGRRDRRPLRKPMGAPGGPDAPAGDPRREGRGAPGGGGGFRGPRPEGGPYRGPPRNEGGYGRGPRQGGGAPFERGPYISPYYDVTFYPEDVSFTALAKTIRASCRTFELFDIAKTVIGKNDRFVVVVQRKPAGARGDRLEQGETPKTAKWSFYVAVPDGLLFETEEAALTHVMQHHLNVFFDASDVEVDPPKGSFQVINKCGVTGELLGPPNYHRYSQIVQQHHAAQVAQMPFEAYRSRIESVRDPEVVNQWLEKMKKITRYTWKLDAPAPAAAPVAAPAPEEPTAEGEPATEATEATEAAEAAPAVETIPSLTFDSLDDARLHLLTHARDKAVRPVESGRFHGKMLETMPDGEIKFAVEGALERQRRFPLDTANALRGRLRREGFTIFKKGSKGVSYVCAVKRKFRIPGQTFATSIGDLISFIETHPMVKASELPEKLLNIAPAEEGAEVAPDPAALQKLSRLQGDLRWLVTEGYVTEFMDGSLFAPPPLADAHKAEAHGEEADSASDFPNAKPAQEKPKAAVAPKPAPTAEPTLTPAPADAAAPADEATTKPEAAATDEGAATTEDTAMPAEPAAAEESVPLPEAEQPAESTETSEPTPAAESAVESAEPEAPVEPEAPAEPEKQTAPHQPTPQP